MSILSTEHGIVTGGTSRGKGNDLRRLSCGNDERAGPVGDS